jgi:RNA polymerase sigma factor (sigma-70 family)
LLVKEIEQRFEAQIREHEALIHKVCRMYAYTEVDRQDLFQDIVIQLWQAYPTFKGNSKISTWLYRVAINTAITGNRKKKDFIIHYEPESLPMHFNEDTSGQAEEERIQQMWTAFVQLNEVEKAIIMLYMEDRSYTEMEDVLGISEGTLRVKMNRIREKLRNLTKTIHYGT